MKSKITFVLALLLLAAAAWALPQGTFFWDFVSPGPNNNYWPAGWTYSAPPQAWPSANTGPGITIQPPAPSGFRGKTASFK